MGHKWRTFREPLSLRGGRELGQQRFGKWRARDDRRGNEAAFRNDLFGGRFRGGGCLLSRRASFRGAWPESHDVHDWRSCAGRIYDHEDLQLLPVPNRHRLGTNKPVLIKYQKRPLKTFFQLFFFCRDFFYLAFLSVVPYEGYAKFHRCLLCNPES